MASAEWRLRLMQKEVGDVKLRSLRAGERTNRVLHSISDNLITENLTKCARSRSSSSKTTEIELQIETEVVCGRRKVYLCVCVADSVWAICVQGDLSSQLPQKDRGASTFGRNIVYAVEINKNIIIVSHECI